MFSLGFVIAALLVLCSYVGLVRSDTTLRTFIVLENFLLVLMIAAMAMAIVTITN